VNEETSSSNFTAADYIARFLQLKDVPAVFELSGGMIAFITDAIHRLQSTSIVNVRHEQAAGFAAEGASRVSGIPSVALATSGPGATNLITAIGSAYFDSTPVLFLTGQVNQAELRVNSKQRQNGFQELDIVQVVSSITKYAVQVHSAEELIRELDHAWNVALEGRPGPVLIDIPIDVQQMKVPNEAITTSTQDIKVRDLLDPKDISRLVEAISKSKFPLILVGGGLRSAGAVEAFRRFAEGAGIPVVFSLMGTDALSSDSKLRVGLIGSYGNRWANRALAKADALLVLGSRLDVRQTGSSVQEFAKGKTIIRVDVDEHERTGRIKADLNFGCSLTRFFENESVQNLKYDSTTFLSLIASWKVEFPADKEQLAPVELNPNFVMDWISEAFIGVRGYVVDVGQHQMWAAQSLKLGPDQRFLTSGGMGAMGFSIPAAIGAASAAAGKWIVIAGDGCAQLSIAELQTLTHYQLPVAVCVINNHQLGMVAQFQEENMDSRFVATRDGYSVPDFMKVADAFGIPSMRIDSLDHLEAAKEFITQWEAGPILLEFVVSNDAKALPKLDRNSKLADL
jgi:acetolactate synthase-1/2/3 large subunit